MPEQPPQSVPLPCLFAADQLRTRVGELAAQIGRDYAGQPLLLVGVLKGAWVFLADLARALPIPVCCDFVKLTSYGARTVSSGEPRCLLDVSCDLRAFHVLVVEDVVDTGLSLDWLRSHLLRQQPLSVRLCTLLDKPQRRRVPVTADYVGFVIDDLFVAGYGIDYAEQYRQLPYIGYVEPGGQDERSG